MVSMKTENILAEIYHEIDELDRLKGKFQVKIADIKKKKILLRCVINKLNDAKKNN